MRTAIKNQEKESGAKEEWRQIRMQRRDEVLERGWKWLRKYGYTEGTGEVVRTLLDIRPSKRLVTRAESWLQRFPHSDLAPSVLCSLFRCESSIDRLKWSALYLDGIETKFSENKNADHDLEPVFVSLMREVLTNHPRARLSALILNCFTKYPRDRAWDLVFPMISTRKPPSRVVERLTARWISLNKSRPDLSLIFVNTFTPNIDVVRATMEWILKGGRTNKFMPTVLAEVLGSRCLDTALRARVVRFARSWLKQNHNNEDCGEVHGKLILVTRSKSDVNNAKEWYKKHLRNESSKYVITDLLELAEVTRTSPDRYAVKRAKIFLRDDQRRAELPRLVGSLVSVSPDPESIAWAKEMLQTNKLFWILIKILRAAPDAESISMALDAYRDWINTSVEPEMIYVLLHVHPGDKTIRRRASFCVKRHPKNVYAPMIKDFLSRKI